MKSILILDNHDSFVYNLLALFVEQGATCRVVRGEDLSDINLSHYSGLILSPGPGVPSQAPGLLHIIGQAARLRIPVLGVCLGHQAIAQYFGDSLLQLSSPRHGQATAIATTDPYNPLLFNLKPDAQFGLYHSWAVEPKTVPAELIISATDSQGVIMAIRHHTLPIYGVQFHPESVITTCSATIARAFISLL